MRLSKFLYTIALLLGVCAPICVLRAQGGRITGRVSDARDSTPLERVVVHVSGTALGTLTKADGRYEILNVPAGTYTLNVRRAGLEQKQVANVIVPDGGVVEHNVTLTAAVTALKEVRVAASADRGTVNEGLERQRKATGVVNTITAEQIRRGADGDAAQAVQRMSGVTVQDGKYIFVRGLGERYTNTTLNGARVPSPEPERKVVPLDLFPTALIQSITTSKTFTPDMPGDFSGAQVNIQTREYPLHRQSTMAVTTGMNTALRDGPFLQNRLAGGEAFALSAGRRSLPAVVAAGSGLNASPTQSMVNTMVRSFRDAWTPRVGRAVPNISGALSSGGRGALFGRPLGYLLSGTYANTQEVQRDYRRAQSLGGATPNEATEIERYVGTLGRSSVLWGGLLNLSTNFGMGSRLTLTNAYNRTADDEARDERGSSENYGLPLRVLRLRYVERSMRSTQLAGEHPLSKGRVFNWALTASGVTRREPDRSEFVSIVDRDPVTNVALPQEWGADIPEGAVRTFADLDESNYEATVNYKWQLGATDQHVFKVGALARSTSRRADNRAFSITAPSLPRTLRQLPPEEIFDGRYAQDGDNYFAIYPLTGGSYDASDRQIAGYGMLEWGLSERLRFIAGARVERSDLTLNALSTAGERSRSTPAYTDILPSATLNWQLSETQTLRVSMSQTLARPEYRELAPIIYREVIGADNIQGNAALKRTLIQNADIRWELYPGTGEVLTIGVFAKHFTNPIERVYAGTSGAPLVQFVNARGGQNFGAEVEARKSLGFIGEWFVPMTLFSNVTVMYSKVDLGSRSASMTTASRAMVGQSPYVLNSGFAYASADGRKSVTVQYNIAGPRIFNAALAPLQNVKEQPRGMLDLSLRMPLFAHIAARADARNLLDAAYELRQGNVVREHYRSGRVYQAGFAWTL